MTAAGRWPRAVRLGGGLAMAFVVGQTGWALWQEWQATGSTLGFPLDDAWIHLAFGRNLAWGLGFAVQPGEPSTASTSLLWSLWVGLLHAVFGGLGLAPVIWAVKVSGLGFAILAIWGASGLLADELTASQAVTSGSSPIGSPLEGADVPAPEATAAAALASAPPAAPSGWDGRPGRYGWLVGALPLLLVMVYPLGWAALSGMEVPAVMAVCTWAWRWQRRGERESGKAGWWARRAAVILWAVAVLLRPESGLVLLVMTLVAARQESGRWVMAVGRLGAWAVPVLLAQAGFYWWVGGQPFPSTLAAKMTARAWPLAWQTGGWRAVADTLWQSPVQDLAELLGFVLVECPVFLILWGSWPFLTRRSDRPASEPEETDLATGPGLAEWLAWGALPAVVIAVGWVAGPEFQTLFHGRYVAPFLWLSALVGVTGLAGAAVHRPLQRWVLLALLMGAALGIGRQAAVANEYSDEVATINTLQVGWALWFRAHRPPGERLALNDVGAMAYFGRQRLLDLEGLITPSSLPWRRQNRIDRYLEQEKPALLLIFPFWYPEILGRLDVFKPALKRSVSVNRTGGGEELVLFTMPWSPPPPRDGWPGQQGGIRFPSEVPDPRF
ncbi:MAG: hypothetical protein OZSIB_1147 [Candidatus Ozemobacter sibiricus]|uniref:Glycosyltransferase RgtA/B/C/D-like domain-containing protein n=1 Tax=Candidatus Ozemobacter sibiricus TaxID=2268124 RepID=A0A367ZL20_9BACT|nr:MAG: hypothetical protein OZSIB_1147 [Candidatus Ozemobacter sibiricus]